MNRVRTALIVVLQLAVAGGWHIERAGAVTETYLFRDSFTPNEGAGNVLVPVSNRMGTIVSSGPDFANGAFVTETISASACASMPTIRAWSFPEFGGLRHDNATPAVITGSYSISMLMRYDPIDSGYARLIDFSNSTQDTGIYKLSDGVSFYPVGEYAPGSFVSGQDVFVTITRDAATQLVSLYINGAAAGAYTDTGNLYAPSAALVYFLMDNTTGPAAIFETDPGVIAYLQVRDAPMTPDEVTTSLSAICDAVSASTTTTTTTIAPATTTTTLPTAGCASAATFGSIRCRLEQLLARVNAEPDLDSFGPKLAKKLVAARSRTEQAESLCGSSLKKARKRLQQAGRALAQYKRGLSNRSARRKLDAGLRSDLLDAGAPIAADLRTLRRQVECAPAS